MARTLIVWGCGSGAGKSWLATALCRAAARRGVDVAPFKAQNMSNNARVVPTPDGGHGEIGTAQYLQALAARARPTTDMNPVLLKPEHDTASQVVVHGRPDAALSRMGWIERSPRLAVAAREGFERLAAAHELVVVEGAGSPAEINLAPHDYVNLGTARWARQHGPARALLVADIDRGGAFAHLHGTTLLLPDDLRPLLAGHVLNRFRGDPALLEPGPRQLRELTGVPLVAVVPMLRDHGLPEEDGWYGPAVPADAPGLRTVAIVAPPRISNLDEFAPLAAVPGLRLVWARTPAALAGAEIVVLPGSKQVSGDLAWLREQGLAAAIVAHAAAGRAVLGVCGGLQMLGVRLDDPQGADGIPGSVEGLGLLPLGTAYGPDKRVRPGRVTFGDADGAWRPLAGIAADGYEIRHGRTAPLPGTRCAVALRDAAGEPIGWQAGSVLGVYAHGLFESPDVVRALFGAQSPTLETSFERLADCVESAFAPGVLDDLLAGR
ncbi:MAG: cobyric acid synthase [Burkholderiales bacterium]|nr:MAG: cobyric acid synthase [Burkholderiales bacterium]